MGWISVIGIMTELLFNVIVVKGLPEIAGSVEQEEHFDLIENGGEQKRSALQKGPLRAG